MSTGIGVGDVEQKHRIDLEYIISFNTIFRRGWIEASKFRACTRVDLVKYVCSAKIALSRMIAMLVRVLQSAVRLVAKEDRWR